MIRRPPRSTLFPTRRSSDLKEMILLLREELELVIWLLLKKDHRFQGVTPKAGLSNQFQKARSGSSIIFSNRSEEHTSELQSLRHLVCRLLLEKKKSNRHIK